MLRRLQLSRIQVPSSALILRGIHHLKMEFPWSYPLPDDVPVAGYYNQFFDALKEMQDLRTLELSHCFPCKPWQVGDVYGVNLPRLEALSLRSKDTEENVHILKRITVLQSCRVSLFCEDFTPPFFEDIRDLAEAHMATSVDFLSPLTMFLSITGDHSPVYILNFWRSARMPRPVDMCLEPDFSLRIARPTPSDLIIFHLKILKDALWTDSIRTLIVEDNDVSWEAEQWIEMFHQNDALENVRASGKFVITFCDAMRTPVDQDQEEREQDQEREDEDEDEESDGIDEVKDEAEEHDEDGDEDDEDDNETEESEDENALTKENVFLRNLKFVELEAEDFDGEHCDEDDDNEDAFHEHLKAWLSTRREAIGTLPTLGIKDCCVSPAQIEELKEITEVDWDHKERIEVPLGGWG
ncbi:hypothetical protein EWM64_g3607 [Hericium alpestre]|uniref:Uncharacterized protein n=1 Tax=Hericium alpestre TaxID=135208 RepID=A0A4Z0A1R5_9AGAM|nr:hypothetical protein EWM64_g3607 [Hericium alpestre]